MIDRDKSIKAFLSFLDNLEDVKKGEILIYLKNGDLVVLRPEIKEPVKLKLVSGED